MLQTRFVACFMFPLLCFQVVYGTGHGAPSSICQDMTPVHVNGTLQTNSAPYTITAAWSSDVAGLVEITLKGKTADDTFQGFMIMSHMEGMEMHKVGKFIGTNLGQVLDCVDYGPQMAATHLNPMTKSSVKVLWVNDGFDGDVIFRATVAQTKEVYWTKVDSARFSTDAPNSAIQSSPTAALLLSATAVLAMLRNA